jgi:hypothetical protein
MAGLNELIKSSSKGSGFYCFLSGYIEKVYIRKRSQATKTFMA